MLRVAGWVQRVEEWEVAEGLRHVVRDELHPRPAPSIVVAVAVIVAVTAARLVALAQVLQRIIRQPDDRTKVGVPLAEVSFDLSLREEVALRHLFSCRPVAALSLDVAAGHVRDLGQPHLVSIAMVSIGQHGMR